MPKLIELMNKQNLNEYLKEVIGFSFNANKYFNDSEPWSFKIKDQNRMNTILFTICEQIKNISILLSPIMPMATNKVLETMNFPNKNLSIQGIHDSNLLNHDMDLKNLNILFKKIEDDN